MPIYEYKCPACQKVFEEWVHLSEMHDAVPCPDCGAASPRIMSETSFVLKGGGWYVTDYGYRKGVKEDGSAPDAKDAKESKGSQDARESKGSQDAKTDAPAGGASSAKAKPAAGAAPAAKPAPKASAGA